MSLETYPMTQEPRTSRSYSIMAELDYRLLGADGVLDRGYGHTKAMSRTSVWLEFDKAVPVGVSVELGIIWPVRLDNKIPLKLVICGRTVQTDGKYAEVEILRHQFRTRALSSQNQRPLRLANTAARTMPASA